MTKPVAGERDRKKHGGKKDSTKVGGWGSGMGGKGAGKTDLRPESRIHQKVRGGGPGKEGK